MPLESKHRLEKTLVYESTSLELILEESESKEDYLTYFCDFNSFSYEKEVYINENYYYLIVRIYSYE